MVAHLLDGVIPVTNIDAISQAVNAGSAADRVMFAAIFHGTAADNITHNPPTFAGAPFTQLGSHQNSTVVNPTRRRMSLWRLNAPAAGSNTFTAGLSASASQLTALWWVVGAASGAGVVAQRGPIASSIRAEQPIVTAQAGGLLYLIVMSAGGTADPYTPDPNLTEFHDGSPNTNHAIFAGWGPATGGSQSPFADQAVATEWGTFAVEVQATVVAPTHSRTVGSVVTGQLVDA